MRLSWNKKGINKQEEEEEEEEENGDMANMVLGIEERQLSLNELICNVAYPAKKDMSRRGEEILLEMSEELVA